MSAGWSPFGLLRALLGTRVRVEMPTNVPADVPAVIARLKSIDSELDDSDGVDAFNRMYLTVTERVNERLQGATFENPDFTEHLDMIFASLYLDAVDATDVTRGSAWEPLFELRQHPDIHPLQYAIAGMNAHINHDLAVATVLTCQVRGLTPYSTGVHTDYQRINSVLAEVQGEVRASYLTGIAHEVDKDLSPVLSLIGGWSIEKARDAAWHNAEVLWELQGSERLYDDFKSTLARTVGLVTRQLLTPVAL
jgi:Family of unknown function (DUF5995)